MFKNVVTQEDIFTDDEVFSDEEYKSLSDDDISDGIVSFKTLHKSNMIKRAISIRQNHEKRLMDEKIKKENMEKEKIEKAEYKSAVTPLLNWVKIQQPAATNFTERENTDFPSLNVKHLEDDDSWISVKAPNKTKQEQSNFKSNIKSKLCGSIMQNKECPHGDKCTFAHSRNELNIFDCQFDNCKFVKFYNNSYHNTHKYYKCEKKHKNETDANYFLRTGIIEPVTEKEMQETYDEYIRHYNMLTNEMRKTINDLPCDKVIVYHGFSYHGNAMASYKQQRHQQQQRPFIKKIWTNFVNVVKSQPTTVVVHKTVSEDPVKVYIRNKNNKNNEIRLLKISIDRTQETITRMKKNNTEFVKKYEKEYKEKMQQMAILEKELSEIKVEKLKVDVEEEKVEVFVEKIKKEIKPTIVGQILEINSNKKVIDVKPEPVKLVIEEPVKKLIEPVDEGWTEVKKNHPKTLTKKTDNIVVSCNVKTQICRSVSQKIKCPYGEKCKYAHKINELNVKNCGFGINCKLVKYFNNKYVNTNTMKSCCYKHPSETNENLYTRIF
jgi:hypothetical protein